MDTNERRHPTRTPPAAARGVHLACPLCGWSDVTGFVLQCPACSGAVEPVVDLDRARVRGHERPELAYLDFLPVDEHDLPPGTFSVATPCRPAPALGAAIGVPGLWVKDESRQPTGTTKDRFAAVVLGVFARLGISTWVAASTGNSSTALAAAVPRDGSVRAHLFCGRDFVAEHRIAVDEHVTLTVVDGTYAEATATARRFAAARGLVWEGGFFNWARREGLKLTYLEAYDEMAAAGVAPDVVVQAISSGMGMMAARKGTDEYLRTGRLAREPRFLMVQQDTCAPMARAWREGRTELTDDDVVTAPDGLGRAILLGDGRATYPYMHRIAADSGGAIVEVSQDDLRTARARLLELEGLDVCHSSAATVASLRNEAMAGRIGRHEVVLVNLTGRHGLARTGMSAAGHGGRAGAR
ncbi:threonine synthase [Actinophytocola oryzae]|uniref:Threonine synthase n=1 Tax=Actinophytocola oryzae TaxID=502181 RepID=A0A4R7VKK8_9PSEU|nr:pyridoxal-phosphate dependent enzyme [Actinophytocola oryzae]TDV49785.1 threonine synthase [Actinophytocola oryzae]